MHMQSTVSWQGNFKNAKLPHLLDDNLNTSKQPLFKGVNVTIGKTLGNIHKWKLIWLSGDIVLKNKFRYLNEFWTWLWIAYWFYKSNILEWIFAETIDHIIYYQYIIMDSEKYSFLIQFIESVCNPRSCSKFLEVSNFVFQENVRHDRVLKRNCFTHYPFSNTGV